MKVTSLRRTRIKEFLLPLQKHLSHSHTDIILNKGENVMNGRGKGVFIWGVGMGKDCTSFLLSSRTQTFVGTY
jgi:hypothetical protein